MNWQEAEKLVERIKVEVPKQIVVVGIEPYGSTSRSSYAADYFVKCACKVTGLRFVVKSFEHWEDLKRHVIVRVCKHVYKLIMR